MVENLQRAETAAALLLQHPLVKFDIENPTTFTSGIKSPTYTNLREAPSYPQAFHQLVDLLKEEILEQKLPFYSLAAVANGGTTWTGALVYCLEKPAIIVNKEAKIHDQNSMINGLVRPEQNYLLIEDAVSTGKSVIEAAQKIRSRGGLVTHVLSVMNYGLLESSEMFQQHLLKPITLIPFSILFAKAIQNGLVDQDTQRSVEEWIKNPRGWRSS